MCPLRILPEMGFWSDTKTNVDTKSKSLDFNREPPYLLELSNDHENGNKYLV